MSRGPAFDGEATPVNIIAANFYEAITNYLHSEWDDIVSELEEERDEEEDEEEDEDDADEDDDEEPSAES